MGDAQVDGLPEQWVAPERLWRFRLPSNGVGGVAVSQEIVVVSSRDASDKADQFFILDATSGLELASLRYDSSLKLDYGNSPRATPVILEDQVLTLGAGGELHAISLEDGSVRWKKHLVRDFEGVMPLWGYSSSPLVVGERVIVQPGGANTGWVALDLRDGREIWRTPGRPGAYASGLLVDWRGEPQWIGFDHQSLGAWDAVTGRRVWEIKPDVGGDFNVPSPIVLEDKIFVVSENNGARLYQLPKTDDPRGVPRGIAASDLLMHDSNSPVRVGRWVAGIDGSLVVLDPQNQLALHARWEDPTLHGFCSLIADNTRLLVTTSKGVCILLKVSEQGIRELGRTVFEESEGDMLAHPAFEKGVLFVRGPSWVDAYQWNE